MYSVFKKSENKLSVRSVFHVNGANPGRGQIKDYSYREYLQILEENSVSIRSHHVLSADSRLWVQCPSELNMEKTLK